MQRLLVAAVAAVALLAVGTANAAQKNARPAPVASQPRVEKSADLHALCLKLVPTGQFRNIWGREEAIKKCEADGGVRR